MTISNCNLPRKRRDITEQMLKAALSNQSIIKQSINQSINHSINQFKERQQPNRDYNEPVHDKMYKLAFVNIIDPDQPVHPNSLIKILLSLQEDPVNLRRFW